MSKLKDLIRNETRRGFEAESLGATAADKRQITIRPDSVTLGKIDTLADILDVSRQALVDNILNQGIDDAIDAYCEAHGPDHENGARDGFLTAFHRLWNKRRAEESE